MTGLLIHCAVFYSEGIGTGFQPFNGHAVIPSDGASPVGGGHLGTLHLKVDLVFVVGVFGKCVFFIIFGQSRSADGDFIGLGTFSLQGILCLILCAISVFSATVHPVGELDKPG